jgi:hypothetical protein
MIWKIANSKQNRSGLGAISVLLLLSANVLTAAERPTRLTTNLFEFRVYAPEDIDDSKTKTDRRIDFTASAGDNGFIAVRLIDVEDGGQAKLASSDIPMLRESCKKMVNAEVAGNPARTLGASIDTRRPPSPANMDSVSYLFAIADNDLGAMTADCRVLINDQHALILIATYLDDEDKESVERWLAGFVQTTKRATGLKVGKRRL